ncbi:MAG: methylated-DNA--[protein]-cysteine S-methyltransferase [Algicola sp.]|nr:methylated-DNA--[protein]-cysteine S-methyltransferase [Algicola sp.]
MYTDYIETPLGTFEFKASDKGITQAIFCGEQQDVVKTNDMTDICKTQIQEYFDGKRQVFDIPLDPQGTAFQQSVWACLSKIPFGEVFTYLDIAKMVNKPKGSQAVGGANGRNPISVIVPCHRVIGTNGSLTGYAGGIERKLWLLNHEGIELKQSKENQQLDIQNVVHTRQEKTEFLS